ncbi:MAG: sensor histidine kinase [Nitrospirae bacterium]|nr:MAG: sensor histidine kinase [Nitrospirota bacterium]
MSRIDSQDYLSSSPDRHRREMEAVRRISLSLFQHRHVTDIVEHALKTALEVANAEAGSVLLADPDRQSLVFTYSIGTIPVPAGTTIPWDHGIAGSVFQSAEPAYIADVQSDPRHLPTIDQATGFHTRERLALPLKRWEGDPIGILEVLNKREGHLDDEDIEVLTIISALTALSIEEARLYEEAKLAEVARLLGDIGHDIKNMLMPVLMGSQLLREEFQELCEALPTNDRARAQKSRALCEELTQMLRTNALRIQERVREISDCVKGLSTPPRFENCQVQKVIEDVFCTLNVLAQENRITLSHEGLTRLPVIRADERRLFNAFYNLVNNAIPETPPGGSITVRGTMEPDGQHVKLSVNDTGRGMPPEIRDSLLTSHARSRKAGGTGLGTKIVKDVVDAHGGTIAVESQEGVRTTFIISLPIAGPVEAHSTPSSSSV